MSTQTVFLLNLLSTWYMIGLIWMVQIVHYNLFDRVGSESFVQYEMDHGRLITPIVGIPMLIEIVTAVWLLFEAPPLLPRAVVIAGVVAVVMIWLTTALLSVPYHTELTKGFSKAAYDGLVGTNWIRTVLWTIRGIGLAYFAAKMMR